jgi:DNA-binding transcriptional regulator YhcF (GntR family)
VSAEIVLDPSSAVPPYEQIRSQVEVLVQSAELREGTVLPTIRQLAHDLGIAPGTVARAYRELEQAGLVESRRRGGTVVLGATRVRAPQAVREERLSTAARDLVATTRGLGLDLDAALEALRRQWAVGERGSAVSSGGA